MRVFYIYPINVIITYRAGRYNLGEITMKQIRKPDSDGNLVVKMQITDLPYVNGLMSILEKYADELPKEMVAELLALPVGD